MLIATCFTPWLLWHGDTIGMHKAEMASSQPAGPAPASQQSLSAAERDAALHQVEKILQSPPFKSSKRCQTFLRYVVEQTLLGHLNRLRERSLGVEVFGREPEYDTNQDPVVRGTAGEVRKRLAQYYLDPSADSEVRIDLPPGTYVPEFHFHATAPEPLRRPPARRPRLTYALSAAAVVAGLAGLYVMIGRVAPSSGLDRFWRPVLDSPTPVIVAAGQPRAYHFTSQTQARLDAHFRAQNDGADAPPPGLEAIPLAEIVPMWSRYIAFGDAYSLTRLSGWLSQRSKPYQMRAGSTLSLVDLRSAPAVLVGAFNNEWTMSLTGELRFYFELDTSHSLELVRDRRNPGRREWAVANAWPKWEIPTDYAIVTRVLDPTTERTLIVVAGITHYGTMAAGEFLTNPAYFSEALRHAPPDWERKNIQVVLSTRVIGSTTGPPKVLETHFW